jgi:rod shape-determining protein MreB and related proteins
VRVRGASSAPGTTIVLLVRGGMRGTLAPASGVPGRTGLNHATIRPACRGRTTTTRGTLGLFDGLLGLLSHDVGIDLGTANTLVTVRNRGIVISEPSVVAMDTRSKRVLAIGAEAKRMVGRTPANIVAIRPLRDGVISDFDVTEQMIRYFINKVHDRYARIPRPRVLVGIPSGVTEVEKRAVRDATINAGARWARLIEEPMAAAIGAGLPVSEPSGSLIVDIGGGTTEVAVVSLGGIVVSRSVRIGGDEMDTDIVAFARREYNLLMGERTAEEIKIAVGSAYPDENADRTVTFRGRDLLTGLPRSVEVGGDQIREALEPSVVQIVEAIKETIEETPPELVADIMDQGIVLAGGGALLAGLDRRVAEATQMPVHIADDPLTCVVRGTGRVLEDLDTLERVLVAEQYTRAPR